MDLINLVLLVLVDPECGCETGIYRDVTTGKLSDHGYLKLCGIHFAEEEAWQAAEIEAERRAEQAAERFFEEGTWQQQEQYRWEVEQDERRAAFWAGAGVL